LRLAAQEGHLHVVRELLKVKAVAEDSAAENNWALRLAANERHWHICLELLKLNTVKKNIADNDHGILRKALSLPEIGVASFLIEKIYKENGISISADLEATFKKLSEDLKVQYEDKAYVEKMTQWVSAVYQDDEAQMHHLLQDKTVTQFAHIVNNVGLLSALLYERRELIFALFDLENVQATAATLKQNLLCIAAKNGSWRLMLALPRHEMVRRAPSFNHHEALKLAVQSHEYRVVALLLELYKENNLSIPQNIHMKFDEDRTQNLVDLLEAFQKRCEESATFLERDVAMPSPIVTLCFDYANLPLYRKSQNRDIENLNSFVAPEQKEELEGKIHLDKHLRATEESAAYQYTSGYGSPYAGDGFSLSEIAQLEGAGASSSTGHSSALGMGLETGAGSSSGQVHASSLARARDPETGEPHTKRFKQA